MASTFLVYPMSQKISLKPGEVYHGSINVAIPAAATGDFRYKIHLYPYSVSGEDYEADLETISSLNDILGWTKLERTGGSLSPNESQKIDFTLSVPSDAPAGGQYLAIGVSSDASVDSENIAVENIFEMASVVYAEIEGKTVHEGEILENYVPSFVTAGAPMTMVTLSNRGNVHETATVTVKIKNILTGQELEMTEDGKNTYESIVMPKTTRQVVRSFDDLPALGVFEVVQDVDYIGQTSNFTTVMLICPIWFMVLVIVLVGAIIGAISGIFYSKQKRKKTLAF